ncbi:MAG: molybdenum cofactor guanylyltransferase [Stenotrophomonas sp.]
MPTTTTLSPTPGMATEPGPIAGIVLAGGLSSRMGRDKALLPWHGRTLLEHICGLLRQAGANPLRVSGNYPATNGIPDLLPQRGPLGGLHSVLATLHDGPAWVVPVDMPLLGPGLLRQLRDAPAAPCVIFAGQPLPMRLQVDSACRNLLDAMLGDAAGPRSLHAMQQRLGGTLALPVTAALASCLSNCNTPAQWAELRP